MALTESKSTTKEVHFLTINDQQPNFENNATTAKLINPAPNEIGRISKTIFKNINKELGSQLQGHSWNTATAVIKWFN